MTQVSGPTQPSPVFVGGDTGSSVAVKLYNNGPEPTVSYEITVIATESDDPAGDNTDTDSITVHIETLV